VTDKAVLRASVLAARTRRSSADQERAARALATHGCAAAAAAAVVTGYAATGTEPPTRALLDGLLAGGARVLLPVVAGNELRWGDYRRWGDLQAGSFGLPEPEPTDDAGRAAARAELAFVPALAVDRRGNRLGRGGGYVDRWLQAVGRGGGTIAVVYDDEVLAEVPHDSRDVVVNAALTPSGVVELGQ
jgi:5-formyltetrahydrofolate cyclo-ligase